MAGLSYVAPQRSLETNFPQEIQSIPEPESTGKPTLAAGRKLSDDQLLAKLHSAGFTGLDKSQLNDLSNIYQSAQDLGTTLIRTSTSKLPQAKTDWVGVALCCLWERWFPDRPNIEQTIEGLEAGYFARMHDQPEVATQIWMNTWQGIQILFEKFNYPSLDAFDDAMRSTGTLFVWLHDFSITLSEARLQDPAYSQARLSLSKFVLSKAISTPSGEELIEFFAAELADCCQTLQLDAQSERMEILEAELDSIVVALDKEYDGVLPTQALRAAQLLRQDITPRLIELIRNAT